MLFSGICGNNSSKRATGSGEVWSRRKNGELFAELLTISKLVDEHGATMNYLGLFSDITNSKP